MGKPGASSNEMHGFPFPGRPGPDLDEPLLDMILNGQSLAPDAPQEMHALAEMLASLAGPAEPGELAGEAAARLAFARGASPAGVSRSARRSARSARRSARSARSARHAESRMLTRLSAVLAVALVAAAVGLGGAAAAYAGALPGPVQAAAHEAIGAPASRPVPAYAASPPQRQPAGMAVPGRALARGWHWSIKTASGRAAALAVGAAVAGLLGLLLGAFSLRRQRRAGTTVRV
jgi:hypothetical protein